MSYGKDSTAKVLDDKHFTAKIPQRHKSTHMRVAIAFEISDLLQPSVFVMKKFILVSFEG